MKRPSNPSLFLVLVGGLALALGASAPVQAGLLPTLNAVLAEGNGFRWTYQIDGAAKVTVQTGDFFTIYDFDGFIPGTNQQPEFWDFSSALTGINAPQTLPQDDPTKPNLTWRYAGPSPLIDTQSSVGVFSAVSRYDSVGLGDFASFTHRLDTGAAQSNVTPADVPVPSGIVPDPEVPPPDDPEVGVPEAPEPTTWVLLGLSLPALGALKLLHRRRRART
jgi:hypothetical protein